MVPDCPTVPAYGAGLATRMAPMDDFDFQSPASWGVPDYSAYPKQPTQVSPEEFLAGVEATVVKNGVWKATWEYRMGGTTRVEITPSNVGGVGCYHTSVKFGGLETIADYDSLEHALRASPPMAYALASVREQGAWKGLIED